MDTKKHIDKAVAILSAGAKVMGKQMVLEVVLPALQEYVASTPTKMDDIAAGVIVEPIQKAVEAM